MVSPEMAQSIMCRLPSSLHNWFRMFTQLCRSLEIESPIAAIAYALSMDLTFTLFLTSSASFTTESFKSSSICWRRPANPADLPFYPPESTWNKPTAISAPTREARKLTISLFSQRQPRKGWVSAPQVWVG